MVLLWKLLQGIGFVDLQDTLSFQIRKTNTSTRT